MKRRLFCRSSALVLALVALPVGALASSNAVSEVGARASGRGYTGLTLMDEPSAIFYNPGNVGRLDGLKIELGASGLVPSYTYSPDSTVIGGKETTTESSLSVAPFVSITQQLSRNGDQKPGCW